MIPLRMKNKNYIGVGKAIAVIRSNEPVDFDKLNITFDKVRFDDDYQKILPKTTAKTKSTAKNATSAKKKSRYETVEATTTIKNKCGIYDRPAAILVQKASSFKSKIWFKAKGKTVDAKSILMVMSMGLVKGTEVTIVADGPDAQEAVKAIQELFDNKFGEY